MSNAFQLLDQRVQIFQRRVIHVRHDGAVDTLSLVSDAYFPYRRLNGSTLPEVDLSYLLDAPHPEDISRALAFVGSRVPDVWEGEQVGFLTSFYTAVRYEEAFPNGDGDPEQLFVLALELWGLPTSPPARDPNNHDFLFIRFQKGYMHYDAATGRTEAVLLGDYFKALLTGSNLPIDLALDARDSRFYRQFALDAPLRVARPSELPNTNLSQAFSLPPGAPTSDDPGGPSATVVPTIAPGISSCQGDETMTFSPGLPVVGNELLVAVTSAKPHQHVRLTGPLTPTFLREREGQRGVVWEWTTDVTFAGRHDFTFYVDSTVVCTANFAVALQPPWFVTATPIPTSSPTPTATPTSTASPTATGTPQPTQVPTSTVAPTSTVVPTATPQVAVAARSTAILSPNQQVANNSSTVTLTVTLLDAANLPVPGKLVRITSDRPTDHIVGSDQFTNSQGQVTASIASCLDAGEVAPVTSTYTIIDLTDSVTLLDTPSAVWTLGAAC